MKPILRLGLLSAAVLGSLGLVAGLSPSLSRFLVFQVDSDDQVIWLNLLWTFFCALPGAALALLAASLFGGSGGDPDDDRNALSFKRPKGLLVLLGFLLGSLAGLVLGGQVSRIPLARLLAPQDPRAVLPADYELQVLGSHQELILLTASRSHDPQVLDRFFKRAAAARRPAEFALAGKRLLELLEGPDAELSGRAAEALTTLADRMGVNASTLADVVSLGKRWEPEALAWLKGLAPLLRQRYEQGGDLRYLRALIWLKDSSQEARYAELFQDNSLPEPHRQVALEGLVMLSEPTQLPVLTRALPGASPTLTLRILWGLGALAKANDPGAIGALPDEELAKAIQAVAAVLPSASLELTCAGVMALTAFDDYRSTPALLDIFDGPHAKETCPRIDLPRPGGPPVAFVRDQELRLMLLNSLAAVALGNKELHTWLGQASQRRDLSPHLTAGIAQMKKSLDEAAD
jgi:hypothetical protein